MSLAAAVVLFAYGAAAFGLGRVKHPANLKLSAVKAEIAKISYSNVSVEVSGVVARLKALL